MVQTRSAASKASGSSDSDVELIEPQVENVHPSGEAGALYGRNLQQIQQYAKALDIAPFRVTIFLDTLRKAVESMDKTEFMISSERLYEDLQQTVCCAERELRSKRKLVNDRVPAVALAQELNDNLTSLCVSLHGLSAEINSIAQARAHDLLVLGEPVSGGDHDSAAYIDRSSEVEQYLAQQDIAEPLAQLAWSMQARLQEAIAKVDILEGDQADVLSSAAIDAIVGSQVQLEPEFEAYAEADSGELDDDTEKAALISQAASAEKSAGECNNGAVADEQDRVSKDPLTPRKASSAAAPSSPIGAQSRKDIADRLKAIQLQSPISASSKNKVNAGSAEEPSMTSAGFADCKEEEKEVDAFLSAKRKHEHDGTASVKDELESPSLTNSASPPSSAAGPCVKRHRTTDRDAPVKQEDTEMGDVSSDANAQSEAKPAVGGADIGREVKRDTMGSSSS